MSFWNVCWRRRLGVAVWVCVFGLAPAIVVAQPPATPTQPPPVAPQPPPQPTPEPPQTPPQPTPEPPPTPAPQPTPPQPPAAPPDEGVVFVGAGDIANCDAPINGSGARATAAVLDRIPGTVFTTGDHAYQHGSAAEFKDCYGPTWGRHKDRTRPAVGNHDLITANGKPYWDYFGEAAGPRGQGFYSYDLGAWHIIALNSAANANSGSDQMKWLRDDLAKHKTADCVLAYWHIARYSSGAHGSDPLMSDAWKILYDAGADVILSSHDHDYERFAPMDDRGKPDPASGMREFVVGTGGGGVYEFKKTAPNSEVRNNKTYGVLKLTLKPGSYDWEFVRALGEQFRDAGSGTCSPVK